MLLALAHVNRLATGYCYEWENDTPLNGDLALVGRNVAKNAV